MTRRSEDFRGRADSFDRAQDELARPFFCLVMKAFRRKMRCALDLNFIYNGESHGKIVIKEALRIVLDRATKKDSATAG
jgi:hypothetical protein